MGIVSDLEKVNFLSYCISVFGVHVYDVVKSTTLPILYMLVVQSCIFLIILG